MKKKMMLPVCLGIVILLIIILWIAGTMIKNKADEEVIFEEGHIYSTDDLFKVYRSQKYKKADTPEKEEMLSEILEAMISENIIEKYEINITAIPPNVGLHLKDGGIAIIPFESFPEDQD